MTGVRAGWDRIQLRSGSKQHQRQKPAVGSVISDSVRAVAASVFVSTSAQVPDSASASVSVSDSVSDPASVSASYPGTGGNTFPAHSNFTARWPVAHAMQAGLDFNTISWNFSIGR